MFNRIKIHAICTYLTVQSCTTLVLMLCITHLDYANAMLYSLPLSSLRKYQTIQNSCTKLILNKKRYSSSSWALKKLHWVPIQQRKEYKILTTTFKCITGMAPKYLQDLISIKGNTWDNMQSHNTGTMVHTSKSSTKHVQPGPSCILHQHYRTSCQNSSKIHQHWTSSRRG